jgi:hypothetical protein
MRRPILSRSGHFVTALTSAVLVAGCGDGPGSPASLAGPPQGRHAVLPASPLATIAVDGGNTRILPYLTDDLETLQDPVNLVLTGAADPRDIRNALLGLDGARGAPFPPVFPFTCTWSEAIGGLMAGYGEGAGWGGTAIQLQCGSYGPIRFHLRLVKLGALTIGNAHFELLIPGTTDHQVLSWELAEQLVTYDLARTGLLGAAPFPTAAVTAAPAHRAIPAVIYNLLPSDLRLLIGGPAGNVTADVGIANDGHATGFRLAGRAPTIAPVTSQREVVQFNQLIPKPFCAQDPFDYLLVQGAVTLEQEIRTGTGGEVRQTFRAHGSLEALPFDVFTGMPGALAFRAEVSERQDSRAGDDGGEVSGKQHKMLLPSSWEGAGSLTITLKVAPGKDPVFDRVPSCK